MAITAPAIDVVFSVCVFVVMPHSTPEFGWTAHMPLLTCCVRMAWLLLLIAIAAFRGHRANAPDCVETLEFVMQEAMLYVVACLLAAPCIVRLVAEQPDGVPDAAALWFWLATGVGFVCLCAECYFTDGMLPNVYQWARCRREARSVSTTNHSVSTADGMSLELLVPGSEEGVASTEGERTGEQDKKSETESEEKKSKRPTVQKLLRLVVKDWPLIIQASMFLLLAAVTEALIPHYVGEVCNSIIRAEERGTLAKREYEHPVLRLLLSAFGCGIFSSCRGATFIWLGSKVSSRLRQELFDQLSKQEIGYFDTTKTGEITSRMTQDCQKVSDQVTLNVNVFLRTLVTLVTTLAFMCNLSKPLTLVAFVAIPAIVVISKKYGRFMQKLSEATQKSLADANAVAEESLSTMSTVRMFAAERLESLRFASKLSTFNRLQQRQAKYYILYLALVLFLPNATTALVLCHGGKLALHGEIKAGMLLSFVFYLQTLNSCFSTLGDFYSSMVQALGAATRVFELKEREAKLPLEPSLEDAVSGPVEEGRLQLCDIHFTYPARPDTKVLHGLSLEVLAGNTVALVGPSGNGKSTVIGLLKRLYKAEEGGKVLLDGVDVWNFTHEAFHRNVSIVGQEPVLYARTIRENIVYGIENPVDPDARKSGKGRGSNASQPERLISDEEIEEAAQTANAHKFISEMKEGYSTEVGERGVQLSGGQKQRIAIARALVRKPKVLLLDEATSALDAESEKQVQQAIDGMIKQGRMTVVIIAHRLSTVRNSHKICVIQGGKVVEEGSHDDLVQLRGAYFNLVESQLSGLAH